MRILQAHNRHSARGGADEVLEEEGQLLRDAGHVVEQFCLEPASATGQSVRGPIDAVWNVPATRELHRLITRFRPDVVHVHTPFPLLSPAVFRTASRMGCPAVTTVHSYRYSCIAGTCLRDGVPCEDCIGKTVKLPGLRHRCYHSSTPASAALTLSLATHRLSGTFSRHVARFIALTDFAAELLVRDGIRRSQVVVKPNAVPDPGPPPASTGPVSFALYAGRLVEEKGIRTLLEAWKTVGSKLSLTIAGDGPLRGLVEAAAATHPSIRYVGWVEQAEMTELLRDAEVLVFPSEWYEAQPLSILRAFASGTPVICSDLENICASVLAADAGAAFRTRDALSLADTVVKLTSTPETLRRMGGNGRAAYEAHHTPQRSLEGLEGIYADVVSERTG